MSTNYHYYYYIKPLKTYFSKTIKRIKKTCTYFRFFLRFLFRLSRRILITSIHLHSMNVAQFLIVFPKNSNKIEISLSCSCWQKNMNEYSTIHNFIIIVALKAHSVQFNLSERIRFEEKKQSRATLIFMQRNVILHLTAKMFDRMLVLKIDATRARKHLIGHLQFRYLAYRANSNHLIWIFRCIIFKFLFVLIDQPKNIRLPINMRGIQYETLWLHHWYDSSINSS